MHNIIELQNIKKRYSSKDVFVLNNVSLSIKESEFIALLGPSGSGKSTLLHIAGLLDSPTDGNILIQGENTEKLSDNDRTLIRLNKIGFVYQYHHLLQEFSALENVMLPQIIAGKSKSIAKDYALNLLNTLGLSKYINMFPSELSGGQKQRVAIARALANDPILLLADEPTGNLDPDTALMVFNDLLNIMLKTKMSAIIATHNYELAKMMNRQYNIQEGELHKE